jgi:hypothetical protein
MSPPVPHPDFDENEEPPVSGSVTEPESEKRSPSTATTLVKMANDRFDIRLADDGTVFALPIVGVPLTYSLRGGKSSLRALLARAYFDSTGKVAAQQALADSLLVLEGQGQACEAEPLHLRVAEGGGSLWLDLGDQTGRTVRVNGDGWAITDTGAPLFRRTALTGALPVPQRGGTRTPSGRW